jgi:hypothetical protein
LPHAMSANDVSAAQRRTTVLMHKGSSCRVIVISPRVR